MKNRPIAWRRMARKIRGKPNSDSWSYDAATACQFERDKQSVSREPGKRFRPWRAAVLSINEAVV
jgi:hypothetical protein